MTTPSSSPERGFSLAEVVLAMGIVAIALLAIFSMFGSTIGYARDNSERRQMLEAVDSLRAYLNEDLPFDTVYQWAAQAPGNEQELAYITYRSNADGSPNAEGDEVRSIWFDPATAPIPVDDLNRALVGKWLKAKLRLASIGNPPLAALPATADNYGYGHLVLQVDVDPISDPRLQTVSERPELTTTLGVLR